MSRTIFRPAAVTAVLAAITFAHPVAADTPDPFPLARGLRDNGMADLAMEYLKQQVKPLADKDPALKDVYRLELAKTLLETADQTEVEVERLALLDLAKIEFADYLKGNPPPILAAEAAVAVARIISLQAQAQLSRSANAPDEAAEKAEAIKARPMFEAAAKQLEKAVGQLESVLSADDLSPTNKRELEQDLIETKLSQAITKLKTADTFVNPSAKEVRVRGDLINAAKEQFETIAKDYKGTPGEYVARAWVGQCEVLVQAKSAADKIFLDLSRVRSPIAAAGLRLARFFQAKQAYDGQNYKDAARLFTAWLRQYGRGRPTAETYAAQYYTTLMRFGDVLGRLPKDPKDPEQIKYPLPPAAYSALREVERGFRKITRSDNDFTERANTVRMKAVRYIVGDAKKSPAEITDFDEGVLTALVKFQTALEGDVAEREKEMELVIALLEKSLTLPPPADSAQDIRDTKLKLVSAYLVGGEPYRAAVLGESMFRSAGARGSAAAAQAGFYAIQAYLSAAEKLGPTEAELRRSDEARAIDLAKSMHAKYPIDPNTDLARFALGQLLAKSETYLTDDAAADPVGGAFQAYAAVSPKSDRVTQARLLEGIAAFEILRPTTDEPAAVKNQVRTKAIADLKSVPKPVAGAGIPVIQLYVQTQLLLAQLHLMNYPKGLVEAEKTTQQIAKFVTDEKTLPDDLKKTLSYQIEESRLRAVFGLAAPKFQEGKFDEVIAKLTPELENLKSAVEPDQGDALRAAAEKLDEFRRERILVLALQTRIRQGDIDAAEALFKKLETLGGSLEATVSALSQLLGMIRPQLDELRKQGEEGQPQYDKLVAGISKLLDEIAARPNLGPREFVFLGKSLKDIGSYERAVPILEKVPPPAKPELLNEKNPNTIPDEADRLSVVFYRGAQLELAQAYREAGMVAESERLLADAMGTDENPGWAKTSPDFRKEALYTMEAKAEAIPTPVEAQPIWKEAQAGWGKIAGEYQAYLRQPLPADPQKAAERKRIEPQVKAMYFGTLYEYLRCLARANKSMLSDNPDNLAKSFGGLANYIKKVNETNPEMDAEVRAKFDGLLAEYPQLNDEYVKVGGAPFVKPTPDEQPMP